MFCKRGHAFAKYSIVNNIGVRVCVPCRRLRKRNMLRRRSGLDVPALATPNYLSVVARLVWERRRVKFGPTGLSDAGLESLKAKRQHYVRTSRRCRRGHLWTLENTRVLPNGKRLCRACIAIRGGQAKIRAREAEKLAQELVLVRETVKRHHPDKGGRGGQTYRAALKRFQELSKLTRPHGGVR